MELRHVHRRTRNINYKWSPYFLRDSRPSETRARVITPREKGETRWGERKMRNHRQSPRFWPFTDELERFWSVKFVSPSKSIKRIQWHSLSHLAVIALFICKLRGRHLPIVLVKVAYYASGSARFLPKLCSNYALFSKLCYFFKKLFCLAKGHFSH